MNSQIDKFQCFYRGCKVRLEKAVPIAHVPLHFDRHINGCNQKQNRSNRMIDQFLQMVTKRIEKFNKKKQENSQNSSRYLHKPS